ncbi:uncharacterized protein PAC_10584 [Phialocephala subalpina]|uniref:Up-regulated during septation protein 1 domain-containing protein n=1 Tax=Phialocephala subalpina TaxID=576137 RepID=A0A1L7X6Q3_9HELO|nr:uncharacterized protein PAC_10584 [Phialocephala subalpina]
MAHIANLMVDAPASLAMGMHNYISRDLSPHSLHDSQSEVPQTTGQEKYVWRMHQPTEPRKYQLFPAKDKLSIAGGHRSADAEQSQSTGMGENGTNEKDRSLISTALRLKTKEQPIVRRRKASITDLGPMTTVQEIAMDSPTIPGRPPLHERSISAPGNSWRQHVFGESMLSCISGPLLDENAELAISMDSNTGAQANIPGEIPPQHFNSTLPQSRSASPKHRKEPLSPKSLAPLVIPQSSSARLARQNSYSRLRSVSESCGTPPDVPPKSARMKESSPHPRASPYTPMSSSTSLLSASTAPTSTSTTPSSALPMPSFPASGRSSPKTVGATSTSAPAPSPMGHMRGQSDAPLSSVRTLTHQRSFPLHNHGHRRHESEASIMDRGRPKKRSQTPVDGSPIKRSGSKRSPSNPTSSPVTEKEKSDEQKAFEHLPSGIKATEASSCLPETEIEVLRKQAIGQASRFEVLSSKDVEALSRELRALDERCEYLRKTHRSLRSGRRNLHDRICTYLRSPRVARFSHESMLKQEEALSELDSSIDDWVSKLEVAENRRTRVRQKLLEHVAAALIMQPQPSPTPSTFNVEAERDTIKQHVMNQIVSSHDLNTPPRSPTKASSPERLQRVVEEVKITSPEAPARRGGRDVESIRIYADSDVYALMADLDEEINRMGEQEKSDARAEKERVEREEKAVEQKREDTITAGLTLHAVTFEGMALHHQRSNQRMQTTSPDF